MSEINPSRPRESTDSMEEPTDESNKPPKGKESKDSISADRLKKRAPSRPRETDSIEEPTGRPSEKSNKPPKGKESKDSISADRLKMSERAPSRPRETDSIEEPPGSASEKINPSRPRESTNSKVEPTGSPSNKSNKPSKGRESSDSISADRPKMIQTPDNTPDCVRIALIGKTGVGKSESGNTILGKDVFKSAVWGKSETICCQKETAQVNGRSVAVVDTPGLFDTGVSNENVLKETMKCFSLLAPGPHVFLLFLSIGTRMTKEEKETLDLIKEIFGTKAGKFAIILFTKGDNLGSDSIEQYIKNCDQSIGQLISDCEGRYHVFNNKDKGNRKQVTELMEKIYRMVKKNGVGFYTNMLFQIAEAAIREEYENMMRERELEIERGKGELKEMDEEKQKIINDLNEKITKLKRRCVLL